MFTPFFDVTRHYQALKAAYREPPRLAGTSLKLNFVYYSSFATTLPQDPAIPSFAFAIERTLDSHRIGSISFRASSSTIMTDVFGNLGCYIQPSEQRKGVATEATRLLLPFIKNNLGFKHITLTNTPDNEASQRYCKALGATHVGEFEIPPSVDQDFLKEGFFSQIDHITHYNKYVLDLTEAIER